MTRKCIDLDDLSGLVFGELSDSRPQDRCADQRANSADHVDAVRTRKIMEADTCQPASAPGPVRFDRIDHRGDDCGVDTVG